MIISLDGMRHSLTQNTNELHEVLEMAFEDIEGLTDCDVIRSTFNEVALYVGLLNCVFNDADDSFNNLSDKLDVKRFEEPNEHE